MRLAILALFALLLAACGSETPATCELGRVSACACPGGTQGAQECGPLGVWSACVCSSRDAAVGDAVADGAADAAGDASTGDVVAVGDTPVADVAADAADVADAAVADAAADVPPDAPTTMPSQTDLVPMQVWLSINGGSFARLTSGRCYRAANNNVMIAAPSVLGTVGVTAAGARASVTLQCPGAIDEGFVGLRHTAFRDGSGAIVAVNTGASARVVPPSSCGDLPVVVERFEVQAFGCGPMSP